MTQHEHIIHNITIATRNVKIAIILVIVSIVERVALAVWSVYRGY